MASHRVDNVSTGINHIDRAGWLRRKDRIIHGHLCAGTGQQMQYTTELVRRTGVSQED